MHLLTETNPKLNKGVKLGYLSFVLHLAPGSLSGHNVCPKASPGCLAACLNLSGRGGLFAPGTTTNKVQAARIRRTHEFFNDRATFMLKLVDDIQRGVRKAALENMAPSFRLNGTSDLSWEKYPVTINGVEYENIFAVFPGVQFMDYTAVPRRKVSHIPNYHLSFSAKENNDNDVRWALSAGMNVCVVFDIPKTQAFPETYMGRPVIDADDTDLRFLDIPGVICGLRSKGQAKLKQLARESGFARKIFPLTVE